MAHQPNELDRTDARGEGLPPALLTRLKSRADFVRAARGRRAVTPGLVLQCHPSGEETQPNAVRLGFTATRKLGSAVIRNRVKRRLRALARKVMPERARPGFDYVLIGRGSTATRPFARLVEDLNAALRQVHRPRGRRRKEPETPQEAAEK